jgi:hypothetical protein
MIAGGNASGGRPMAVGMGGVTATNPNPIGLALGLLGALVIRALSDSLPPTSPIPIEIPDTAPPPTPPNCYEKDRHHRTPKEILDWLRQNGYGDIADDPRIRGVKGAPNQWPIERGWHKAIDNTGAGLGPRYNDAFLDALQKVNPADMSVEKVEEIRDQIVKDYNLKDHLCP